MNTEKNCERAARNQGWTTIEDGGWAGNLICHRSNLNDRAGAEYASWSECCKCENIKPIQES